MQNLPICFVLNFVYKYGDVFAKKENLKFGLQFAN